ncbi:putative HC-toxin efflux carrier TOXA [Tolypocladium ophioglossoides CBS 100239]|uniref:Putative HC-toxin efflux carrier TOXA n=1 Tax=Tolypocladium ophioglossoides (strain CBS 100239) TaxID=1163406 RepID=A0A0L0N509_TOLOC|nr:putative HC-toxin efflux carrier TOXA [Tolypocladium ophioglossoides CBS 100239]
MPSPSPSVEKPLEIEPSGQGHQTSSELEANVPLQEKSPEEAADASPREIHGILWFLVVIGILSSIFLYSLDNTVVADITPVGVLCDCRSVLHDRADCGKTAVNRFGDVVKLPWLSVGFLLGGSAVVLPFGKLYGLFDAKWLYVMSSVIFNVGSAICGAAPNMNALIVGRVLAGMGGNGMYLGVMTLLSVNTSDRERPGYLSFVGLVWGIGTVLGPVVGGAFVESPATWRWAFYINLCVAGLFAPVYIFLIPSFKPRAGTKITTLLREIDIVGTILSIGAIITLVMAINFGGALYAWGSGQIIALFVVSGALFIIFGVQQGFPIFTSVGTRIFPCQFMRNINAILLYICASAVNTAGFIPIYYVPLYFQFTRGDGAIKAAVRLLPLIFVLSASILANGHLMSRFSYFQPWYIFGSILTLVGGALLSRINPDTPEANIYGYEILVGIGTGCYIQAGYAVIQGVVPATEMAYGIGFMMLAQLGGIAFGLAIAGAVFINDAIAGLSLILPDVSRSELQLAISGTSGAYFQSLPADLRAQSIDVIVAALQKVFIPVYVGAAVSLIASVCFTQRKLFKDAIAIAA